MFCWKCNLLILSNKTQVCVCWIRRKQTTLPDCRRRPVSPTGCVSVWLNWEHMSRRWRAESTICRKPWTLQSPRTLQKLRKTNFARHSSKWHRLRRSARPTTREKLLSFRASVAPFDSQPRCQNSLDKTSWTIRHCRMRPTFPISVCSPSPRNRHPSNASQFPRTAPFVLFFRHWNECVEVSQKNIIDRDVNCFLNVPKSRCFVLANSVTHLSRVCPEQFPFVGFLTETMVCVFRCLWTQNIVANPKMSTQPGDWCPRSSQKKHLGLCGLWKHGVWKWQPLLPHTCNFSLVLRKTRNVVHGWMLKQGSFKQTKIWFGCQSSLIVDFTVRFRFRITVFKTFQRADFHLQRKQWSLWDKSSTLDNTVSEQFRQFRVHRDGTEHVLWHDLPVSWKNLFSDFCCDFVDDESQKTFQIKDRLVAEAKETGLFQDGPDRFPGIANHDVLFRLLSFGNGLLLFWTHGTTVFSNSKSFPQKQTLDFWAKTTFLRNMLNSFRQRQTIFILSKFVLVRAWPNKTWSVGRRSQTSLVLLPRMVANGIHQVASQQGLFWRPTRVQSAFSLLRTWRVGKWSSVQGALNTACSDPLFGFHWSKSVCREPGEWRWQLRFVSKPMENVSTNLPKKPNTHHARFLHDFAEPNVTSAKHSFLAVDGTLFVGKNWSVLRSHEACIVCIQTDFLLSDQVKGCFADCLQSVVLTDATHSVSRCSCPKDNDECLKLEFFRVLIFIIATLWCRSVGFTSNSASFSPSCLQTKICNYTQKDAFVWSGLTWPQRGLPHLCLLFQNNWIFCSTLSLAVRFIVFFDPTREKNHQMCIHEIMTPQVVAVKKKQNPKNARASWEFFHSFLVLLNCVFCFPQNTFDFFLQTNHSMCLKLWHSWMFSGRRNLSTKKKHSLLLFAIGTNEWSVWPQTSQVQTCLLSLKQHCLRPKNWHEDSLGRDRCQFLTLRPNFFKSMKNSKSSRRDRIAASTHHVFALEKSVLPCFCIHNLFLFPGSFRLVRGHFCLVVVVVFVTKFLTGIFRNGQSHATIVVFKIQTPHIFVLEPSPGISVLFRPVGWRVMVQMSFQFIWFLESLATQRTLLSPDKTELSSVCTLWNLLSSNRHIWQQSCYLKGKSEQIRIVGFQRHCLRCETSPTIIPVAMFWIIGFSPRQWLCLNVVRRPHVALRPDLIVEHSVSFQLLKQIVDKFGWRSREFREVQICSLWQVFCLVNLLSSNLPHFVCVPQARKLWAPKRELPDFPESCNCKQLARLCDLCKRDFCLATKGKMWQPWSLAQAAIGQANTLTVFFRLSAFFLFFFFVMLWPPGPVRNFWFFFLVTKSLGNWWFTSHFVFPLPSFSTCLVFLSPTVRLLLFERGECCFWLTVCWKWETVFWLLQCSWNVFFCLLWVRVVSWEHGKNMLVDVSSCPWFDIRFRLCWQRWPKRNWWSVTLDVSVLCLLVWLWWQGFLNRILLIVLTFHDLLGTFGQIFYRINGITKIQKISPDLDRGTCALCVFLCLWTFCSSVKRLLVFFVVCCVNVRCCALVEFLFFPFAVFSHRNCPSGGGARMVLLSLFLRLCRKWWPKRSSTFIIANHFNFQTFPRSWSDPISLSSHGFLNVFHRHFHPVGWNTISHLVFLSSFLIAWMRCFAWRGRRHFSSPVICFTWSALAYPWNVKIVRGNGNGNNKIPCVSVHCHGCVLRKQPLLGFVLLKNWFWSVVAIQTFSCSCSAALWPATFTRQFVAQRWFAAWLTQQKTQLPKAKMHDWFCKDKCNTKKTKQKSSASSH